MNVVACRVDERLVHGQIMTSWSKHLQLKRIVVVDDKLAADDFMKQVLVMSAPSGLEIDILPVSETVTKLESDTSQQNTMLLFKTIPSALALAEALKDTSHPMQELNLGNLGSIPGRTQVTKNVFLSEQEKEQVNALGKLGVNVFLQMLYTDPRVSAGDAIK
ncbi:MAG: PTS system mannose/fructose/N-acetylgalactosamine-transporter subunit IIB [Tractidigestivibacter sp.]|jgi:mannose/fructose/N-acetylgalactosamine-specific phosphotransferase system component IIB|uniref:PTS system mannose/fructose/N-acetylgalactosamine-transporter subunit IIB n=1 Tax=Tractidigestivibacter sp. TaxID=2847320 RepID=UPI003D8E87C5